MRIYIEEPGNGRCFLLDNVSSFQKHLNGNASRIELTLTAISEVPTHVAITTDIDEVTAYDALVQLLVLTNDDGPGAGLIKWMGPEFSRYPLSA